MRLRMGSSSSCLSSFRHCSASSRASSEPASPVLMNLEKDGETPAFRRLERLVLFLLGCFFRTMVNSLFRYVLPIVIGAASCSAPTSVGGVERAELPPNVLTLQDEVIGLQVVGTDEDLSRTMMLDRPLLWDDFRDGEDLILVEHTDGVLIREVDILRDGSTLSADMIGGRGYLLIRQLTPRLARNHDFLCGLSQVRMMLEPDVTDEICRFVLCPPDVVSGTKILDSFPALGEFVSSPEGPFGAGIPDEIGGWGLPFGSGNKCDQCVNFGRPDLIVPTRNCVDELLDVSFTVEIQINNTPVASDDYLTWAPTRARARLLAIKDEILGDQVIHFTNDAPGTFPEGGDIVFGSARSPWPENITATQDTLALTLPASGAWVEFVVAGKFGQPSTADKDAVILARLYSVTGLIVGTKAMMVRVRKNGNTLGEDERNRFLAAMKNLRNRKSGGYLMFQELHRLATTAGDEGHGQPAFYPWHRALLLQVERELQQIDPSVTLPYWDWDAAAPNIFHADFMGASKVNKRWIDEPNFSATNPLVGWNTDLLFSQGKLMRNTEDHARKPEPSTFLDLDSSDANANSLIKSKYFGPTEDTNSFSRRGEVSSHNPAHAWPCGGGHITNANRSSADPLFYVLHCQVDRQWAYWQWKNSRFGTANGGMLTFSAPEDYDNTGSWNDPGVTDWQQGSFLEDGMWPWDGSSGGSGRAQRPVHKATSPGLNIPTTTPSVSSSPFPKSKLANLWPPIDSVVRPKDTIDYLGRLRPHDGLGFCYDDVPYN